MAYPLEALPQDHFQGLGNLATDEPDSLRSLLNRARSISTARGYHVDPDQTDIAFATINAAYAAGDAELPAGEPVVITLAPGKNHSLSGGELNLNGSRPVLIKGMGGVHTNDDTFLTTLVGNIVLTAADAASDRLVLGLRDLRYSGVITGASNWEIQIQDCYFDQGSTIARTHGTSGCRFRASGLHTEGGTFRISDTDAASNQNDARVHIQDSFLSIEDDPPAFDFAGPAYLVLTRVIVSGFIFANRSFIDAANSTFNADLSDVFFEVYLFGGTTFSLISNGGSSTVYFRGVTFDDVDNGGGNYDISANTVNGEALVQGLKAPVNPFSGLKWHDRELSESLTWDGAYWGNSGIYRKDLLVDVGSAAVSHTTGWTVPTGAGIITVSANALKALTAGGGATLYGISDGSDGDKFAESSALIKNSKASAKQASINVGAGDTLYVHSMTSSGTEGGTLAGSNDKDVRVVVYFVMPKTLPDV